MILIIGKPAEFDEEGLPLRGQTQPYHPGWRLRAFHRGEETLLMEGTYYVCRQVQIACAGQPADAIPDIVARMQKEFSEDLQETAAMDAGATIRIERDTPSMEDTRPTDPPAPAEGGDDTVALPREEMDEMLKRRRKDFRF